MKKILIFSAIILAFLLLLPLTQLQSGDAPPQNKSILGTSVSAPVLTDGFKVFLTEQNTIVTLSTEDYLFGVLAGEMPALYEEEALKAQAVCAYTFALWRQRENGEKGYDITDDYTIDQCYLTPEKVEKKWGSKSQEYEKKIRTAIKSVEGEMLTYNGDIILSVYHAVSSGRTETAKNVWGKDYPYLQSVSSVGDKLATNYISTLTVTPDKLKTTFSVSLPQGLKGSFSSFSRTESGAVDSLKIGGTKFDGNEVRQKLGLKSSNFEVALKNGKFVFTVYGYGHGVGMSQNGANYMAQQGSDYQEILKHYFKGCEIENSSVSNR